MSSEPKLLDLLDPKKTTSPITSLPRLSAQTCRAFSAKSRAPTCSTKSSGSPENAFEPPAPPKAPREKAQSKPRPGDWVCLVCGNHNYSFRESCNRCQKQSRLANLRQSRRILENPALKADVCKDEVFARRLEFNFRYSLNSAQRGDGARSTLNANVVSRGVFQMPVPFAMGAGPRFPDFFFAPKVPPFAGVERLCEAPFGAPQMLPGFRVGAFPEGGRCFPEPGDFASKFSGLARASEISPLLSINGESGFPSFKKGAIKSDICHDKSVSQVGLQSAPLQHTQQNLVEKFKRMNLLPKPAPPGDPSSEHRRRKGPAKGRAQDKENQGPRRKQKRRLKFKPKRRGKVKYKAVEVPKASTQPAPGPREKLRARGLDLGGSNTKRGIGVGKKEPEQRSREASPPKMSLSSIFDSKVLFDFETPKKARANCFLFEGNAAEDSGFKAEKGFSRHKKKLLRLFSQSDDEESEEERASEGYFEEMLSEREFSESLGQMQKTGFGARNRVF